MANQVIKAKPARDPLVGQLLGGRYRVVSRIGRGGMGIVYLGEHEALRKRVAIKTLASESACSQEAAERFLREARAAAAVGHEHVVDVTDIGELESGAHYFVLEYLEGSDLGFRVDTAGRFDVARTLDLLFQLCDALEAVHAAGIVHRDLKPDNVFLVQRRGRDFVKVLDFGVCKIRDPSASLSALTGTGATLGTPNYMAPEQIEGSGRVDQRADVYALGAIAYFMLIGEPPFQAGNLPKLFMRICTEDVVAPQVLRPEIPTDLNELIVRTLAKDPDLRYPDCGALRAALRPLGESLRTTLRDDPGGERRVRQSGIAPASERTSRTTFLDGGAKRERDSEPDCAAGRGWWTSPGTATRAVQVRLLTMVRRRRGWILAGLLGALALLALAVMASRGHVGRRADPVPRSRSPVGPAKTDSPARDRPVERPAPPRSSPAGAVPRRGGAGAPGRSPAAGAPVGKVPGRGQAEAAPTPAGRPLRPAHGPRRGQSRPPTAPVNAVPVKAAPASAGTAAPAGTDPASTELPSAGRSDGEREASAPSASEPANETEPPVRAPSADRPTGATKPPPDPAPYRPSERGLKPVF